MLKVDRVSAGDDSTSSEPLVARAIQRSVQPQPQAGAIGRHCGAHDG